MNPQEWNENCVCLHICTFLFLGKGVHTITRLRNLRTTDGVLPLVLESRKQSPRNVRDFPDPQSWQRAELGCHLRLSLSKPPPPSPCTTDSRGGVEKEEGDLSTWRQSRQRVSLPLFDLYLWARSSEVRVRMTMPQQRTQSFTCAATPDPDTSGIPFPVGLKARTEGTRAWCLDAWW